AMCLISMLLTQAGYPGSTRRISDGARGSGLLAAASAAADVGAFTEFGDEVGHEGDLGRMVEHRVEEIGAVVLGFGPVQGQFAGDATGGADALDGDLEAEGVVTEVIGHRVECGGGGLAGVWF